MNSTPPKEKEYTIPPGTAWEFEKYVSEICDRAEIDREDKVLLAYELQTHLQEAWRDGIDENLTTDDAQQRAIERLGSVESVARSLKEKDWRQFIWWNDARPMRFFVILAFCCAESWFDGMVFAGSTHNRKDVLTVLLTISDNLGKIVVVLAGLYFIARLRLFWAAFIGAVVVISRWLSRRFPLELAEKLAEAEQKLIGRGGIVDRALVTTAWCGIALYCICTYRTWAFFIKQLVHLDYFCSHLIWAQPRIQFELADCWVLGMLMYLLVFGIMAILAALIEIFDLPRFKRKRRERERRKREWNESKENKLFVWLSDALPY
jgi:hypothetical protein